MHLPVQLQSDLLTTLFAEDCDCVHESQGADWEGNRPRLVGRRELPTKPHYVRTNENHQTKFNREGFNIRLH
jgi:hypothetical protein